MNISQSTGYLIVTALLCLRAHCTGEGIPADKEQGMKGWTTRELSNTAIDLTKSDTVRWEATSEIAIRKDPATISLLIGLLNDRYHSVRGSAAWGLSQIGGANAQDALLTFLQKSLQSNDWGVLARATEAQKELPDKRALDLLIECLKVDKEKGRNYGFRTYAAEALGKIGNPKASLVLAQQLEVDTEYSISHDYLYLKAIRMTKGREAIPILIDYLDRLVTKMAVQNMREYPVLMGREARQASYNFNVYGLTISALETLTGRKSVGNSREQVARDWKDWWNRSATTRSSERTAE